MNEKEKTQTVSGVGGLQRAPESQITKSEQARQKIKALEAREARLYAARGHGGYIDSAELDAIRAEAEEARQTITSDRPGLGVQSVN